MPQTFITEATSKKSMSLDELRSMLHRHIPETRKSYYQICKERAEAKKAASQANRKACQEERQQYFSRCHSLGIELA